MQEQPQAQPQPQPVAEMSAAEARTEAAAEAGTGGAGTREQEHPAGRAALLVAPEAVKAPASDDSSDAESDATEERAAAGPPPEGEAAATHAKRRPSAFGQLLKTLSQRVAPVKVTASPEDAAEHTRSAPVGVRRLQTVSSIRWLANDMDMRTSLAVAVGGNDSAASVAATLDLKAFIREVQDSERGVQGAVAVIGDSGLLDETIREHDGRMYHLGSEYVEHFGGLSTAVTASEARSRLNLMFSRGLARAAENVHAALFTAGLDRGPVAYMGRAAMDRGNKLPMVAVLPMARATWPGDPRPGAEARVPIHPGHSHVVMATTDDDEGARALRFGVIEAVLARNSRGTGPLPVVGVLVSGGEPAIDETLACVRRGWPLVVVQGSGGAADAIAWAYRKENHGTFIPNPKLMEIVRTAVIEVININDADGKILQAMLERLFKTMLARAELEAPAKATRHSSIFGGKELAKGVLALASSQDDMLRVRLPPVEEATGASVMVNQAIAIFEGNSATLARAHWCLYGVVLALSVALTALVAVRNDSSRARVGPTQAHHMDLVIFFLPILSTIVISVSNRFQFGLKAKILTAAAEAMRKELYTYRARVEAFASVHKAEATLSERYRAITERLQSTPIGETALDRRPLVHAKERDYAVNDEDDGFSVLSPDTYIKLRLEPAMDWYANVTNLMDRANKTMAIIVIIMSATGTGLAVFGLEIYISVTTSVSAALMTLTESLGYEPRIMANNRANSRIYEVLGWWKSRSPIEQANPQKFSKLVRVCERALSNERRSTNPGTPMVEQRGTGGELSFNIDEFIADVDANLSEGKVQWSKMWMEQYEDFFDGFTAWVCNVRHMKRFDGGGDPMLQQAPAAPAALSPPPSPPMMASLPPSPPPSAPPSVLPSPPPSPPQGDSDDEGGAHMAAVAAAHALVGRTGVGTAFSRGPRTRATTNVDFASYVDHGNMQPPLKDDDFFERVEPYLEPYLGPSERTHAIMWDPTRFGRRCSSVVEPDTGTSAEKVEGMLKLSDYILRRKAAKGFRAAGRHPRSGTQRKCYVKGLINVVGASEALDKFVAGELASEGQYLPDGISAEETIARLQMVFTRGIMSAAEQVQAVVLSGGWDVGPAGYAGRANRDRDYSVPLVAVNCKPKVTWPGDLRPGQRGRLPLQPDHTHVVLLPTDDGAVATKYRFDLAEAIAFDEIEKTPLPAVAFVVNGGDAALRETLRCVRKGWPIVCIRGSGGVADRLYKARQSGHAYANDPMTTEIVQEGNVEFIELSEVDGGTTSAMIQRLFKAVKQQLATKDAVDPSVQLAWEKVGEYEDASHKYKRQSKLIRNLFIALGIVTTACACSIEAIRAAGLAEPLSSGWSVTAEEWLGYVIIVLPVLMAAISAVGLKLRAGQKSTVLKLAAERIRSEVYRWRTRTGDYNAVTVSDRDTELDERVQTIQREVNASVVAEGGLGTAGVRRMRDRLRNNEVSKADDGVSTLSPEDYIEQRLNPILLDFERKARQITTMVTIFNVLNYVLGGVGTALAVFRETRLYVSVSVAVAAALVTVSESSRYEEKLIVYNRSLMTIRNLLGWWLSLTDIEKSNPQKFAKLVSEVESACLAELAVLAMNAGDDDDAADNIPSLSLTELRQDIAEAADAQGRVQFMHNWVNKHPQFFEALEKWLVDEKVIEEMTKEDKEKLSDRPALPTEITQSFVTSSVIDKHVSQCGAEAREKWLVHLEGGGTLDEWLDGRVRDSSGELSPEVVGKLECDSLAGEWANNTTPPAVGKKSQV